ncbi:unnamed protein product [Closterium sp. NIES-54]
MLQTEAPAPLIRRRLYPRPYGRSRSTLSASMARKRKGQALNDCPKDLDDIPYIRWMNQHIANGRHPKGLSAPPVLDGQGSSAQSPSAAPSRVCRQPARTAATHRLVVEQDAYDDDDDDPEQGLDTDDDEEEPEDAGMSPSDGDNEDEDAEDDAEEEAQPVSVTTKRSAAHASGTNKGKGKAAPPPPRLEPRKKRSAAPVEKGLWSDKESAIFAAAKWFMKEELEPLKGKQGTQYWDTAAAAPHAVDGGGATDVNVPAGMEVPSSSQPGTSTPTFTAPPPPTTATPRRARVHKTATMKAAKLVSTTIKYCHGDAMTRIESPIHEGMAQDMRLARERMTESAPPDVHRAPPDFSPPPPRGESAPPPKAAQHGDDVGDVNTVTPGAEDVEIWVRGTDD